MVETIFDAAAFEEVEVEVLEIALEGAALRTVVSVRAPGGAALATFLDAFFVASE